ncbi:required for respiratory growth protein 9, mitochondrial [Paraphoma chrysanthemicola]|uniref:Required for respiratory growth protein 9, mitochondrial n=1 Tax=Paraphoma chrysanthemicola TaxID=798071 RepID=A0A8K0RDZ4_9PLEO|nr:required for respiratory growth protein 9, mitochondrial [Paraphoma chrysanthemicola]
MSCHNCARTTLGLFIRSLTNTKLITRPRPTILSNAQPARAFTTARRPYRAEQASPRPPRERIVGDVEDEDSSEFQYERPSWQAHKAALKEKLNGEAWNPRKKLSPDTMEGIRHLHSTQPDKFTTPILAEHFKVSPEAIRRILKSKWRPSDEESEARMQRWNKRGERIWTNLVEMGVKPPKQWRDMGVGRASNGERPRWKSLRRNMVDVNDSASNDFIVEEGDIIPIVDGSGRARPVKRVPVSDRL